MPGTKIAELLRVWRERALLTQEQLAEMTGLSERTIRRLESGTITRPRGGSIDMLAGALSLTDEERATLAGARVGRGGDRIDRMPQLDGPAQLPHVPIGFVGRDAEVKQLDEIACAADGNLVLIAGMAGIGKTALAVHAASRAAAAFPDGQLFIDLRGFDSLLRPLEPGYVLQRFLRALNVDPAKISDDVDEASALYRTELAQRRVLVVLDNAHSYDQVRALLPGAATCLVIVTSRHQLPQLLSRGGARLLQLDPMLPGDADTLLHQVLTDHGRQHTAEALEELASRCSYLPLALRVAAAHLVCHPLLTIERYCAQISESPLSLLDKRNDVDAQVSATLSLSYQALAPADRRLFRLASLIPGATFSVEAAAALLGVGWAEARDLIETLCGVHLITEQVPSRYGMHDLVRHFARDQCARNEPDRRLEATRRLFDFYAYTIYQAYPLLGPRRTESARDICYPPAEPLQFEDRSSVLEWFDLERDNVLGVLTSASQMGWHICVWQLANDLFPYCNMRRRWPEWRTALQLGLASAETLADSRAMAHMENAMGVVSKQTGDYQTAHAHYSRAINLAIESGENRLAAAFRVNLGGLSINMGKSADGISHLRAALACQEFNQPPYNVTAYLNLGCGLIEMDQLTQATEVLDRALALARTADDVVNACHSHDNLAEVALRQGDPRTAWHHASEQLRLAEGIGDPLRTAAALDVLASTLAVDDLAQARDRWRQSLSIYRELNHRAADVLSRWLHTLDTLSDPIAIRSADDTRRRTIRRLL